VAYLQSGLALASPALLQPVEVSVPHHGAIWLRLALVGAATFSGRLIILRHQFNHHHVLVRIRGTVRNVTGLAYALPVQAALDVILIGDQTSIVGYPVGG